jgi:hypothetical protein
MMCNSYVAWMSASIAFLEVEIPGAVLGVASNVFEPEYVAGHSFGVPFLGAPHTAST